MKWHGEAIAEAIAYIRFAERKDRIWGVGCVLFVGWRYPIDFVRVSDKQELGFYDLGESTMSTTNMYNSNA